MRRAWALVCFVLTSAAPVAADVPFLSLPIDCVPGETCFIQNYVDHDPGPGFRDFRCHGLGYDGHKGTDFALATFAQMTAGVSVRAAAPGTVRGVRDGEPDTGRDGATPGKDCGNGVVIDHGGGWQTQYCHMKRGSLSVRTGQRVATGAVLGQVGFSGQTEFPHLHLSLRKYGAVVDPFDAAADVTCDGEADSLWRDTPAYEPGGLILAGFAGAVPSYDAIKAGTAAANDIPANASALVLWAYAFGGRAGDVLDLTITGPDGVFATKTVKLDRPQAQFFRAAGRKLHAGNRRPGLYRGEIMLLRDGEVIDRTRTTITLLE